MNHLKISLLMGVLCANSWMANATVNIYGGDSSDQLNLPNNSNFSNWNRPLVIDAGRYLDLNTAAGLVANMNVQQGVVVGGPPQYFPMSRPLFNAGDAGLGLNGTQMLTSSLVVGLDARATMSLSNGATLNVSGNTTIGSGAYASMTLNGSTLNQGNNLYVLGASNSQPASPLQTAGQLTLANNSVVNVNNGVLGVGWNGSSSTPLKSSLIINNSVVNGNVVIGSNGYLGGNGTIHGNLTNYGTINPGNSPGTIYLDGTFTNGAGGKLVLEVASNGSGGYVTDKIVFAKTDNLGSLGTAPITFALGAGVSAATFFASAAFDLNTFFLAGNAASSVSLSQGAASTVVSSFFSGTAFQYTDSGNSTPVVLGSEAGVEFLSSVSSVPEPAEWAMLLVGLGFVRVASRKKISTASDTLMDSRRCPHDLTLSNRSSRSAQNP
jgi:hypothetical protein